MLSYLPLIASFSTFSAVLSFLYIWPKYLLLGVIRVTFFVSGFRLRYKWVGDSKSNSWGRCRMCYAERRPRHNRKNKQTNFETIVFLHGFTSSKDVWLSVCKKIPRHYRIIAVDLPGHGGSSAPKNPSFDSYVESMDELLTSLGIKSCTVVGFSLGGPLSAILAQRLPHIISKLVLVAPAMRPPIQSKFWEMLDTGNCIFLTRSVDDVYHLFDWIRYKTLNLSKYIMRGIAAIRSSKYDYYQFMYEELFTDENIGVLERIAPQINTPTYLVWGEHDLIIDKSAGGYLKELLGPAFQDIAFLPECGHSVSIEQPEMLASLLLKWNSLA